MMLIAVLATGAFTLAGCAGEPSVTPEDVATGADAATAADAASEDAPAALPPSAELAQESASGGQACMIAGEFEILGRKLRSRDCLQAGPDIPADAHRQLCEGLAETSAQIGEGKAGTLEYMTRCPTPAQGSCRGIFGQPTLVAFYYERTDDDLATLPASCGMGGGTWEEAGG